MEFGKLLYAMEITEYRILSYIPAAGLKESRDYSRVRDYLSNAPEDRGAIHLSA